MKKQESKNRKVIIILSVLLLLLVSVIGIYFYKQKKAMEFKYDWEEQYYNFLKTDMEGKGSSMEAIQPSPDLAQRKNPKIAFIDINEKSPVLIVSGEKQDKKTEEGYYDEANISVYLPHPTNKKYFYNTTFYNQVSIVMLYKIDTKEYGWYVKEILTDGVQYTSIKELIKTLKENDKIEKIEDRKTTNRYTFLNDTNDFYKTFIEIKDSKVKQFTLDTKLNKTELKKLLDKKVEKIIDFEDFITKKVKDEVEKEIKRQEETKKAKEEENKKTEESKNEANSSKENTNQQEPSYIKAGNYTLAYGTYKSVIAEAKATITLNRGGTCTYVGVDPHTGGENYNVSCTYKIIKEDIFGYGDIEDGIEFSLNNGVKATFRVDGNNNFGSDWLGFMLK